MITKNVSFGEVRKQAEERFPMVVPMFLL